MPFHCSLIEPIHLSRKRRHQFKSNRVFEEFDEVSNHALVGVLMQLSSLTFHAEEMFAGILADAIKMQKRCEKVCSRIERMQDIVHSENSDDDEIGFCLSQLRGLACNCNYHLRVAIPGGL